MSWVVGRRRCLGWVGGEGVLGGRERSVGWVVGREVCLGWWEGKLDLMNTKLCVEAGLKTASSSYANLLVALFASV